MPHKDPATRREYHKQYREAHREELAEKYKQRYQQNKEEYRERTRKWYAVNQERANYLRTMMRKRAPWKYMLKAARERAVKKKVPFSLTEEWARDRYTGRCEITGLEFTVGKNGCGPAPRSPTIDRKNPSLGYTHDNCRFVLACVNGLKHNGTDNEMYSVVRAIVQSDYYASFLLECPASNT